MGSPLAPILANLFMGHHEEQWIDSYKDSQLLYYRRYVDDTFCLFHNEQDAMKFLSYLNLMGNSLSLMFWWIARGLLVSLQYITRALTLGFLQISLASPVLSTRLVSFTHWLTEFLKSTTPPLDGKKIFVNYR